MLTERASDVAYKTAGVGLLLPHNWVNAEIKRRQVAEMCPMYTLPTNKELVCAEIKIERRL
jgi:hypothetical protein